MPNVTRPARYISASAILLLGLTLLATALVAQQTEIPPKPPEVGDSQQMERIVRERPRWYRLRRALHPVSWLQAGVNPLLRTIEGIGLQGLPAAQKSPPSSGMKFGLQGLGSGSGFGPEVRVFHNNLFNKGIEVEMPVVMTYKTYQSLRFRANYPLISGGSLDRLGIEFVAGYASRPSDRFFGIGNDSLKNNESMFESQSRTVGLAIEARVDSSWKVRAESGYRRVGVTRPRAVPYATEAFSSAEIPGLITPNPVITMTTHNFSVQRNTKDHPHVPASGGVQSIEAELNESRSGGNFSYWRYRADLQQYVPLSADGRKVLAFRASAETNQEKAGNQVPFFDLPAIGGRSSVRGFEGRRFIDKSAMNVSAEYRYRIWRHFDWALFVDAGQVAPEVGDFGWDRFHKGYGMRFIAREGKHAVSVDVARSREAWGVYVDFSPKF